MKAPWNEPRGYRTLMERQVGDRQQAHYAGRHGRRDRDNRLHDWRGDAPIGLSALVGR